MNSADRIGVLGTVLMICLVLWAISFDLNHPPDDPQAQTDCSRSHVEQVVVPHGGARMGIDIGSGLEIRYVSVCDQYRHVSCTKWSTKKNLIGVDYRRCDEYGNISYEEDADGSVPSNN